MRLPIPSFKPLLERARNSRELSPSDITITGIFAQSGQHDAWWTLDESLELSAAQPTQEIALSSGTYLSFSTRDDHCLLINQSQRTLVRDMMSDVGESIFTQHMRAGKFNPDDTPLSRRVKSPWLYGSPQARVGTLPEGVTLIPGLAAIRAMLASHDLLSGMEAPFVTGVLFTGQQDVQVLILMVCRESGEFTDMDYVPLAGLEPADAVRSFVQTARLSSSGEWTQERTAIFSAAELAGLHLKPYPRQAQFLGVATTTLWKKAAVASAGALVLTAAAGLTLAFLNRETKAATQRVVKETQQVHAEFVKALSGPKLGSVLQLRSIDVRSSIKRAGQVWQQGALVSFNASRELLQLTVTHKVQTPEQSPQMLAKALQMAPPDGCTRQMPATTLQLTELYLTYECQTPDVALQRIASVAR